MRHIYQLVLLTLIVLALAGCERTRTITVDELRSKIGMAISLASESELFIGQIANDRLTREFQAGHANYLRREAIEISEELGESRVDSVHIHNLRNCSTQLELLVRELEALQVQSDERAARRAAGERVQAILKNMEAAKAGL